MFQKGLFTACFGLPFKLSGFIYFGEKCRIGAATLAALFFHLRRTDNMWATIKMPA
jgi:hypothetical protein